MRQTIGQHLLQGDIPQKKLVGEDILVLSIEVVVMVSVLIDMVAAQRQR